MNQTNLENLKGPSRVVEAEIKNLLNPYWRLTNLYYIVDKYSQQTTLFRPNPVQLDFFDKKTGRDFILKSRQLGFSTALILYNFDRVIFNENFWCAIICHEHDSLDKLFRKVEFAWDRVPQRYKEILPKPYRESKYEIFFRETNSRIYVDLEVRSGTNSVVHFSEYAFIQDENRIIATLPTVPTTGEVYVESTPNGIGNRFHREYQLADAGQSEYCAHFYEWWWDPNYKHDVHNVSEDNLTEEEKALIDEYKLSLEQIQWRRDTIPKYEQPDGSNLFFQEYPENKSDCFLKSGSAVFNNVILKKRYDWLKEVSKEKPIYKEGYIGKPPNGPRVRFLETEKGPYQIFELPQPGLVYCIGADSASGLAEDYSTMSVRRIDTWDQVATFMMRLTPGEFADELSQMGEFYNFAYINPERTGIGTATITALMEKYPIAKIYEESDGIKLFHQRTMRIGYNTSTKTKPILVRFGQDNIRRASANDIHDIRLIEQMMEYQKTSFKGSRHGYGYSSPQGKHDDLLIADLLCLAYMNELGQYAKVAELRDIWSDVSNRKNTKVIHDDVGHWAAW